jgi:hypothetical protein
MSKLGTYKYIDDDKLKKKFEVTSILENTNNVLDTYYKDTLRDFSPDKPTFTYEEKRKNTDSNSKLNLHLYGRRNTTEPFQNDLFLGFTDKDPRSIHDGPLMGKYQEQMWKRKDDYKFSFKDDSDYSIPTKGISESVMQKNKKITYSGFKDRYKNFEESNDAWAPGFKPIKSDKSKVNKYEIDNTIMNLSDIKDLANRRDVINEISLTALPTGWESVPDHKYKIAKYNKLLAQKRIKDINILKNKQFQETDNKINILDSEQKLLKQLLLDINNFKNKKISNFNNQEINYKMSKDNQNRTVNNKHEFLKNNEILNTEFDDKKNKIIDTLNSKIFSKKEYDVLNKILHFSEMSNNTNYLSKGNNKELLNNRVKDKEDILNVILRQSIKSNNESFIEKGNNKQSNNKQSKISFINNNNSEFLYNNNELNNDYIQKNSNNYEVANYSNIFKDINNNYKTVKDSIENKLNSYDNEKNNQHRKPNNQSNDALHANDFDIDGEFNDSGYKDRKNGFIGSKYMFNKKEYENGMDDEQNINDMSNIKKKSNFIYKK